MKGWVLSPYAPSKKIVLLGSFRATSSLSVSSRGPSPNTVTGIGDLAPNPVATLATKIPEVLQARIEESLVASGILLNSPSTALTKFRQGSGDAISELVILPRGRYLA